MTEQDFYKDFPSLKNVETNTVDWADSLYPHTPEYITFIKISEEELKKHCLDKQKVREAIDKEKASIQGRLYARLGL